MQYAGTDATTDSDPDYLARLAKSRSGGSPGVYQIRTYPSRTLFDLAKPKEADVRIADIAHALSMQCRFAGHCPVHWSIAQHSVLVAYLANVAGLPREHYAAALLHDAHEAYCNDVTSPMKRLAGRAYTNPADDVQAVIHKALGLPTLNAEVVGFIKRADELALNLELEAIEHGDMVVFVPSPVGAEVEWWSPWSQYESEISFVRQWNEYLRS